MGGMLQHCSIVFDNHPNCPALGSIENERMGNTAVNFGIEMFVSERYFKKVAPKVRMV